MSISIKPRFPKGLPFLLGFMILLFSFPSSVSCRILQRDIDSCWDRYFQFINEYKQTEPKWETNPRVSRKVGMLMLLDFNDLVLSKCYLHFSASNAPGELLDEFDKATGHIMANPLMEAGNTLLSKEEYD